MPTTPKKTTAEQRAEYEVWHDEQVRLGLEDIDAGRIVSHDEIKRHFDRRFKQNAGRQQKQAA